MEFLTDFADQAVVLPLALVLGLMLAIFGWPRAALAWAVAVGAALGLTLAAKLILLPCSPRVFGTALRTPSGHTAAAAVVYGGLVALLLPRRRRLAGAVAASAAVGGVIAATRLMLGVHTGSEVAVGGAIGMAGAVLLVLLAGDRPGGPFSGRAIFGLLAAAAVLAVLLHGLHLPAELVIQRWAFAWQLIGACTQRPG